MVPKAHSDIHNRLQHCCERRCGGGGEGGGGVDTRLGASEILITPKRAQRSRTGYISHLRAPGTASSDGQEQNGFHLA